MDRYEKEAILYPAIAGMIIPMLLTSAYICTFIPDALAYWKKGFAILGIFVPVTILYAAIGYWIRLEFVYYSKMIFQYPLFKQDETEMPTTRLLLWYSPERKSDDDLIAIAKKVKTDFGITLLTKEEEKSNPTEAKKRIVDAVGKMREVTRGNQNLQQYNRRYGFCRNYLGATIFAVGLILIAMICNYYWGMGFGFVLSIAIFLQLLFGISSFLTLKAIGYDYAKALYNAYLIL